MNILFALLVLVIAQGNEQCTDANTCPGEPGIDFAHMWTTPFMNVRPHFVNREMFNKQLSAHAMKAFEVFKATHLDASNNRFVIISEKFFQWQRDNFNALESGKEPDAAFTELWSSTAYVTLRGLVLKYATQYLRRLERHETVDHIFCWVGLTYEGMYHLSHTHPDSMLSAVYYSQTPPSSGAIVFDDPRGPRPPFDGKLMHSVRAGELLIFPSWLVHEVIPTQGDVPRISFACNMKGQWETTTDVSVAVE